MLQLNGMGADLRIDGSDLRVHGVPRLSGADLSSFNDHRVLDVPGHRPRRPPRGAHR